jgi:hypothetical protein
VGSLPHPPPPISTVAKRLGGAPNPPTIETAPHAHTQNNNTAIMKGIIKVPKIKIPTKS